MPVANLHMPLLMFLWASSVVFASNAAADSVAVAQLKCDQRTNTLTLKYVQENDDFISEPKFPLSCRLGRVDYKVTGMRDAPREGGMCGAQPPIFISVLRNRIPVISEATFGENCFQGPAISLVTISEERDVVKNMIICVLRKPGADPLCVSLPSKVGQKNDSGPISQSDISDFAEK